MWEVWGKTRSQTVSIPHDRNLPSDQAGFIRTLLLLVLLNRLHGGHLFEGGLGQVLLLLKSLVGFQVFDGGNVFLRHAPRASTMRAAGNQNRSGQHSLTVYRNMRRLPQNLGLGDLPCVRDGVEPRGLCGGQDGETIRAVTIFPRNLMRALAGRLDEVFQEQGFVVREIAHGGVELGGVSAKVKAALSGSGGSQSPLTTTKSSM
jgi:hypothetical protein